MNSALGGSGLPSTSETRLPSPPAVRGAIPIPQSVSDSAVEKETPQRQRVSFDSDRDHPLALAQVSIHLLLGVLERVSKNIALRRIYPARGTTPLSHPNRQ